MLCLRCAGQFAPVSRLGVADAACAAHFREPELGLCLPGEAQVCLALCTEYSEELVLLGLDRPGCPPVLPRVAAPQHRVLAVLVEVPAAAAAGVPHGIGESALQRIVETVLRGPRRSQRLGAQLVA